MKFIVSRTSNSIKKPCKEAKKIKELKYPEWTIEINTLEELINFSKKYGKIVFGKSIYEKIPFRIEIYDDCRE